MSGRKMDFWMAIGAMLRGRRVRRMSWQDPSPWLCMADLLADDWEIVE
jgi:hypothetical protein